MGEKEGERNETKGGGGIGISNPALFVFQIRIFLFNRGTCIPTNRFTVMNSYESFVRSFRCKNVSIDIEILGNTVKF